MGRNNLRRKRKQKPPINPEGKWIRMILALCGAFIVLAMVAGIYGKHYEQRFAPPLTAQGSNKNG